MKSKLFLYNSGALSLAFIVMIIFSGCKRNYTETAPYAEGLARVKYYSHWGYIDEKGEEVIGCKYSFATDFSGGFAGVREDEEGEKFHFIDKTGNRVDSKEYDSICLVKNAWAVVRDKQQYFIISIPEKERSEPMDTLIGRDNKFIALRGDSMAMIVFKNRKLEYSNWHDLLFPQNEVDVVLAFDADKWCLLDSTGTVCSQVYDSAGTYEYGSINEYRHGNRWLRNELLTVVTLGLSRVFDWFMASSPDRKSEMIFFSGKLLEVSKNGKWGYIDQYGKEVIPIEFSSTKPIENGMAMVSKNRKMGCYNDEGKEIIPVKYDDIRIRENYLIYGNRTYNSNFGVTTFQGKEIVPCEYQEVTFDSPLFIATNQQNKVGIYDTNGKVVCPFKYDEIQPFNKNSVTSVKLNRKYGCINEKFKEVTPLIYDHIDNFSQGMAAVEKNELYGYIDSSGKEVIKVQYETARPFDFTQKAWVTTVDDKNIWIDKKGTFVRNFP